VQIVSIHIVD